MVGYRRKSRTREDVIRDYYCKGYRRSMSELPLTPNLRPVLPPDAWDLEIIKKVMSTVANKLAEDFDYEYLLERDAEVTTEELKRFPAAMQKLRETLNQSLRNKSFKPLSPSDAYKLIENCRNSLKDVTDEDRRLVTWAYGTSPRKFFLKWMTDLDQCRFLRYWLTAQCRGDCLKETGQNNGVVDGSLVRVGDIVAAEFLVDKYWYRAEILEIRGEEAKCLFIDYGNEEICSIDQLRILPKQIVQIPRMAFQAKLAGRIPPDDKIEGNIMLEFVDRLKTTPRMSCKILGYLKGSQGVEVVLQERGGDPPLGIHQIFAAIAFNDDSDSDSEDVVKPYRDDEPVEKEKELLCHLTEEFPPHHQEEVKQTGMIYGYEVIGVSSPDEIYVRNITAKGMKDLEVLEQDMSSCYSNLKYSSVYKIRTTRIFRNRPYVWFNKDRNKWERVRVERTDLPRGTAYVQRIDFGSKEVVLIDDMMELRPLFWKHPPMAELAHLVHVKPKGSGTTWSRKTCKALQALCYLDQRFIGLSVSFEACSRNENAAFQRKWNSLGLLLYIDKQHYPYTIQGLLVGLGYAEATGVGASHAFIIFQHGIPRFDCGVSGSKSLCNGTGHVVNGGNDLDSFDSRLSLPKPVYSVIGDVEWLASVNKITPFKKEGQTGFLGYDCRSRLGWVEFCRIDGPGHFYLHSKQKQYELLEMMKALGSEIEHRSEVIQVPEQVLRGSIVAVRTTHRLDFENFYVGWNRAFVIKSSPELRQAWVILLDFGIETRVKYEYVQPLPRRFSEIPAFCCRAHLEIAGYSPAGLGGWSSDADYKFMEYVKHWTFESPMYLAFRRSVDTGIITFEHYDQKVKYDQNSSSWMAADSCGKHSPAYAILNEHRHDKLVRHLFQSIGLEIYYEEAQVGDDFRSFEPIWNGLVEYLTSPSTMFNRQPPSST